MHLRRFWVDHGSIINSYTADQQVTPNNNNDEIFRLNNIKTWEGKKSRKITFRQMPISVDERTGYVTSSRNNIPLHLCAVGTYNLTIGYWKDEDFTVIVGPRKMLEEPQRFCYFTASLQFTQTDRMPPKSLVFFFAIAFDLTGLNCKML